ncbi:MAG TPA: NAD(+)/NADH kinase [Phycisphaerae bacterium]|jgi:NAD+ kinase|nr:NAD(+)/NADH kinase [Phycisphaerae bacterium]
MDIALIPNPEKPDAMRAAQVLLELLTARAKSPGANVGRVTLMHDATHPQLVACKPQLAVVLGGDGTILCTAQRLGGMTVPIVGINFGKLGYLAAFSLEEFIEHLDLILANQAPQTKRLMLQAALFRQHHNGEIIRLAPFEDATPRAYGMALNDVVINAGEPFRLIELELQIDEERTTVFRSDGLVVATASGSTGYNLSAGGPLISPKVPAMVITPICPYTLSFRPVVLPESAQILVIPRRLNAGTRVNFDGQFNFPIAEDECLLIRRAPHTLTLIENPTITHWQMLAQKMHWARSPRH